MRAIAGLGMLAVVLSCGACRSRSAPQEATPEQVPAGTGTVVIVAQDTEGRQLTERCDVVGSRSGRSRRDMPGYSMIEVTPARDQPYVPGECRGTYSVGWHSDRIAADGYIETWSPVFRVRAGAVTRVRVTMQRCAPRPGR